MNLSSCFTGVRKYPSYFLFADHTVNCAQAQQPSVARALLASK
jgi:hypothetical protein